MKKIFILIIITLMVNSCQNKEEKEIEKSLHYILDNYPEVRLTDIYKSFFQDYYGPGHLVNDSALAIQYLEKEIGETRSYSQKKIAEPTGYLGNFVRIDLYAIQNNTIPKEIFYHAFIKSAKKFKKPDINDWKKEWQKILMVIEKMDPGLESYNEDRQKIQKLLNNDEYVVHHSQKYLNTYDPHYRIIWNDIYENELKKYLP